MKKLRPYILVRPPSRASNGASTIREGLGDDNARLSRISPVPRQYKYVINWGNPGTDLRVNAGVTVLNKPDLLCKSINKLEAFNVWRSAGVRVPDFHVDAGDLDRSNIYLARTVLTGSAGAGIVVVRGEDALPSAPLYVRYVRKTEEYRAHVAFGKVIFVQQKLKVKDREQTADEKLIRNYDNGWIFSPRVLEEVAEDIKDAAVAAVSALGLDFGAVDLIRGRDDNHVYILECNSAPGLESPGLITAYTDSFLSNLPR